MGSMVMLIQQQTQQPPIDIAWQTLLAIIVATTIMVCVLLFLIWSFTRTDADTGPLRYGNFFVVIFGIMAVLIGFLVAFPLVVSRVFPDPTQVIALLSALFGTIVGLVGTYFGVKASSDASDRAQQVVQAAVATRDAGLANGTPPGRQNGGGPANGGPVGGNQEQVLGQQGEEQVTTAGAGEDAESHPRST